MPAVFVHGVPATHRFWNPVLDRMSRKDVIAVALPGLDSSAKFAIDGTKESYIEWLIGLLQSLGEAVDLVGHDWGCLLALRVASLRPDLVRTLAVGGASISPDRQWHAIARTWQTPGAGERYFRELNRVDLIARWVDDGLPADVATEFASHIDAAMGAAILKLYRSALTVFAEWHPDIARIQAPSTVFYGTHDKVCTRADAEKLARDIGASALAEIQGGHWFPLQQPAAFAQSLEEHWARCAGLPPTSRAPAARP